MKIPEEIPFTHFERVLEAIEKITDSTIHIDLNSEIDKAIDTTPDRAKRFMYGHMSALCLNVMLNKTYLGKIAIERATQCRVIIKSKVDQLQD